MTPGFFAQNRPGIRMEVNTSHVFQLDEISWGGEEWRGGKGVLLLTLFRGRKQELQPGSAFLGQITKVLLG